MKDDFLLTIQINENWYQRLKTEHVCFLSKQHQNQSKDRCLQEQNLPGPP